LGREAAPGAVAAEVVHGDGFQHAFLEGAALDVVARAVEAGGDVDAKAGDTRERDLVADIDLSRLLAQRRGGRGQRRGKSDEGPTKSHEIPFQRGAYFGRAGTIEGPRAPRH
jgi:hypothetical protein